MPSAKSGVWVKLLPRQWETVTALLSQEADGIEADADCSSSAYRQRVRWIRAIVHDIEPLLTRTGAPD